MRYAGENSCSTLMPKILGTYEMELNDFLVPRLMKPNAYILDIGAAEGYYTVGALWMNATARVTAFEMDKNAQKKLKHLAEKNGVDKRVEIYGECNPATLEASLMEHIPDLMIMDVEGAELELLSERICRLLSKVELIIEVHPWVHADIAQTLIDRLAQTHKTEIIYARTPEISDIPNQFWRWVAKLHPEFRRRLINERPEDMSWILGTPASQ